MIPTYTDLVAGRPVFRKLVVLAAMLLVAGLSFAAQAVGAEGSEQMMDGGPVGQTGDQTPGGNPVPGSPGDGSDVGPVGRVSEDLREDLEGVAQEMGISLEEAIRRYGWHNDFATLALQIQTAFPADFSAAAIGDDDQPWISFAGKAPADAVTTIRGFTVPVRIFEGRGFTEVEMNRRLEAIHRSVVSDERITDAVSGYDIVTGVFDVTVQLADQPDIGPVGVVNELRQALPDSIRSLDLDIEFRVADHALSEAHALVGGGVHLSPKCTAGFVVENSSGDRNLTTAGHCDNSLEIDDIDFDETIDLEFEDEHEGTWGDVQRHSVPDEDHSLVNTFRYNSGDGDFRFVTSTGVARAGQWLEKYGKVTGKTRDRVYRTNVCVDNNTICKVVLMRNDRSEKGDSGGPWFWGNRAYGIHQGGWFVGYKVRDAFTPVSNFRHALSGGWEVATS